MDYAKIQEYMATSQPHMAIEALKKHLAGAPQDLIACQLMGEALLEIGEPEQAYEYLKSAADADPTGARGGFEKFLWLGQLVGGRTGIDWYERGISGLQQDIAEDEESLVKGDLGRVEEETRKAVAYKRRKLCETLCGIVEIWMTDLCMEEEAEAQCDSLMKRALETDATHAESWSVLASVRISQLRNDEAKEALLRAWDIFRAEKEPVLGSVMQLTKMLIEMGLLDEAIDAAARVHDLNDEEIEGFYLEGLASFTKWQQDEKEAGETGNAVVAAAAFANASKLYEKQVRQFGEASVDPEVVQHIQDMNAQLPEGLDIDEGNEPMEGWEDEIDYDDE